MINFLSGINNSGYVSNIQKRTGSIQPPEEKKVSKAYASDPTAAIKSELSVKMPMPYTFIRDINIPYSNPAKFYKLANGQKVIILPKKGSTVVQSYFNVGSMNERESEKGIFHFIEHMKFNGSENLKEGEFFELTNKMGASTNASTGMSTTDYYVQSQMLGENDLENTIKIHADMLQTPTHTPEMVEKEKGPVTSEISMVSDEPVNLALNNCIKNLFGIKTSVPDVIAGTISTVNNLTSEKVRAYDDAWYSPDNCVTVITGNVDAQKTIELVSKYFNNTKSSKIENRVYTEFSPLNNPVRNDVLMPKAKNSTVVLGFTGPKNRDGKEMIIQNLVMDILLGDKNSRISSALDKIHCSGMFTTERVGNRPDDPTAILLVSQTSPEKTGELLKAYYNAIQSLKTNPIGQKELDREKLAQKITLSNISESSKRLNELIGSSMMNNTIGDLENHLQILDSITPKDINEYIAKYLDLNKVSLSLVHPEYVTQEMLLANRNDASAKISFKGQLYQQVFDSTRIKQYNLNNKMTVVFNPNTSEITNYKLSLNAKIPAQIKPATAEILAGILQEGSAFRDNAAFYTDAHEQGIYLSLNSDSREIELNCTAPASKTVQSLKYAKEAILHPRFTQESLDYAKSMMKEAVSNAEISADDKLYRELFPNISEFATIDELKASIDSVTLDDIKGLYMYIMKNAQADFVMTAPVEKNPEIVNKTLQELSCEFPVFNKKNFDIFNGFTPISESKLLTKDDKRIQAEIEQAYTFKVNTNPKDRLIFTLLNSILGGNPSSRLFSDLRENQMLAYRVNSDWFTYGDTGVISLYIKTTTDDPENNIIKYDNVKKSLDGFKKHIEKLKTEKVSDEELDAAKLRLKTNILNETESSGGQTHTLLSNLSSPYSTGSTDLHLKLIDEITADDIYNAANYVFGGNPITSIVASENTLKNISGIQQ